MGVLDDKEISKEDHEQQLIIEKDRWKERKRMAWTSVYCLIAILLLFFFAPISDERLKIIADPISMMAFVFGGVITAFMGFQTYEKFKLNK